MNEEPQRDAGKTNRASQNTMRKALTRVVTAVGGQLGKPMTSGWRQGARSGIRRTARRPWGDSTHSDWPLAGRMEASLGRLLPSAGSGSAKGTVLNTTHLVALIFFLLFFSL
ncbi:hypothetical protein ElyMa_005175400 [Elysia marginata]|uniref:Uncharacterized protein n=1 Tax=Elysia marginata TaxID=1093978 RepID=A0AAV4JTT0_9GAST|nr:hypothetical protein ElyMa_005175400 [Elysia marginata]